LKQAKGGGGCMGQRLLSALRLSYLKILTIEE
jgi:hypothetical protein